MLGKVGCIVYMAALLLGCLVGSVLKVDLSGVVNKKRATSGFGLKLMRVGSLVVSGPWALQLSCWTIYKVA